MLALTLALALAADPPTHEQAAAIELEQRNAQAEVSQRFGNKKSSEMTADERREMIRAQVDADKKVLEKNGVDAKTWARYSQSRDREEYKSLNEAKKALAEEEKAKAGVKPAPGGDSQPTIEKGVVTQIDLAGDTGVEIERGCLDEADSPKPLPREKAKAKAKGGRARGRRR